MSPETRDHLFGTSHAFDRPITVYLVLGIAVVLALSFFLGRGPRPEGRNRLPGLVVLSLAMVGLVLLGAFWTIAFVLVLSLLCYREFARATGLFREKMVSLVVVLGILAVTFAILDNWYRLFVALFPLTVGILALSAVFADRPQGYIQRVALGVLSFALFGSALGHLGYMTSDADYRPRVLLLLLAVAANDLFASTIDRFVGRGILVPNTNPDKTLAGTIAALVLTAALVAGLGHYVYQGTALDCPGLLALLGVIVSAVGQMGSLMLFSVKRDLGIKDFGSTLPGQGGLLDQFASLILVSPAMFHYVNYFVGFGAMPPTFPGG